MYWIQRKQMKKQYSLIQCLFKYLKIIPLSQCFKPSSLLIFCFSFSSLGFCGSLSLVLWLALLIGFLLDIEFNELLRLNRRKI